MGEHILYGSHLVHATILDQCCVPCNRLNCDRAHRADTMLTQQQGVSAALDCPRDITSRIHENCEQLRSIFDYYAKSGTAGSSSATTAMTMQSTELGNLAMDCNIVSEKFNMTRVINIHRRADQVDDTFKASDADHRVIEGETAKGGDHGLGA